MLLQPLWRDSKYFDIFASTLRPVYTVRYGETDILQKSNKKEPNFAKSRTKSIQIFQKSNKK